MDVAGQRVGNAMIGRADRADATRRIPCVIDVTTTGIGDSGEIARRVISVVRLICDTEHGACLLCQLAPTVIEIAGRAAGIRHAGQATDADITGAGVIVAVTDIKTVISIVDQGNPSQRIVVISDGDTARVGLLDTIARSVKQHVSDTGIRAGECVLIAQDV